ncbi:TOBE domain-containing protein [Aggregatibacter actinomycetemcomitans]|nr:TOBE domain-containing protein [Aggregatibacter actinomycetemcomitans]
MPICVRKCVLRLKSYRKNSVLQSGTLPTIRKLPWQFPDRLAIMATDGSIEQIGTPWEIYEKSANETVFKFMGLANFIPVRYEQGQHLIGQGSQAIHWHNLPQESGKLGCRPSDIILSKQGEGLHAKVVRASFLGTVMDYMLEIDGITLRTEVPTNKALQQDLMFTEGESCYVNFHDLLWFPNPIG